MRARVLDEWLERLLVQFAGDFISVDATIARAAGAHEDDALGRGHDPGLADILIAATASVHGLVVLTANTRHFSPLGAATLNPLSDPLPPLAT